MHGMYVTGERHYSRGWSGRSQSLEFERLQRGVQGGARAGRGEATPTLYTLHAAGRVQLGRRCMLG
jgi:hypothetical protein